MKRDEILKWIGDKLSSPVDIDMGRLSPSALVTVGLVDWYMAHQIAKEQDGRFLAFWVDLEDDGFIVYSALTLESESLVLRTVCPVDADLNSIAPVFCAADRPERHARDLFGIGIVNAPDERRWVRHQAWSGNHSPLRDEVMCIPAESTPPDDSYPFISAHGSGVMEVPVGPVHAGIIEPGHFRFHTVGEKVLNLEQHLGYTHKGIELPWPRGRDVDGLARLAARVSGDSTVAHSWAACQAVETATGTEVPERALWLRALMAERERVANFFGDIGGICNDVGFAFAQAQLTRLKESWLRQNLNLFGHRMMMDCIIPGGVRADVEQERLTPMVDEMRELAVEFSALIDMLEASESLEDRLMNAGKLTPDQAKMLGATGYVGKASGQDIDARRDAPYAPYDKLSVEVPVFHAGDVAARAKVRADEVLISLRLIEQIIGRMTAGAVITPVVETGKPVISLGMVEGWRGQLITFVRLDAQGKVARFFPRDPSWLIWPALELLQQDNIIADFPVCNKSVNGSYSGQDL